MACNRLNLRKSNKCTNVNIGMDYIKNFTYKDSNGNGVDLSGYNLSMRIRRSSSSANILTLSIVGDATSTGFYFTDIANGEFTLRINSSETLLFESKVYVYDIIITNPSGDKSIFTEGDIEFTTGKLNDQ